MGSLRSSTPLPVDCSSVRPGLPGAYPSRYHGSMRYVTLTLAIALGCAPLSAADTKAPERLWYAAGFLSEGKSAPETVIPQDLLNRSQCVILVPGLKKAAFVFGA